MKRQRMQMNRQRKIGFLGTKVWAVGFAMACFGLYGRSDAVTTVSCSSDADCNDVKSSTVNVCHFPGGVCQFTKVDANCNDGFGCTNDGCDPTNPSSDPVSGCVFARDDSQCNDGIACTEDG